MKKNLYSLLVFLSPLAILAQPTVTQSDLPVAGLAFTMGVDSPYTAAIPAGGANQTWNFASLPGAVTDTFGFIAAAGTPYQSAFSGSNLSSYDSQSGDYTYYTTNSSGFYVDGFASSTSVFALTPSELFAPVPFTYNDTRTNVARIVIDTVSGGFSIRVILNITSVFNADGYGTLILPNATYSNTLRMRITETTYDSTLLMPFGTVFSASAKQKTHFRWFKSGNQATYILGIDGDSLGNNATRSEYLLASTMVNVENADLIVNTGAFPNPASERLQISRQGLKGEARMVVYNSLGERIESKTLSQSTDRWDLDVSAYTDGLYYYSMENGTIRLNGKFTVLH